MVVSHGLMAMAGLRESGRLIVAGDDRQLPPIRAGRDCDGRAPAWRFPLFAAEVRRSA
ncbi:hypothetical protein HED50_22845 [Ochrobactrum oryzae]|nr:hypothetical protein [Brucella oryzae]